MKIVESLARNSKPANADILAARREIARSIARENAQLPPEGAVAVDKFLAEFAPSATDPFCGNGSILLEAQRLGMRAYGSDSDPIALLLTKALVEIPPLFKGKQAVNPEARSTLAGSKACNGAGSYGLAADVRHYSRWIRNECENRIGHLFENSQTAGGTESHVIAWLWARTVASPSSAAKGRHVPLVDSFVLSSKKGKEAVVVPILEPESYSFTVKSRVDSREEFEKAKLGTKSGPGAGFTCLISGSPIPSDYIESEDKAKRIRARLMAVVAEGANGQFYLSPTAEMENAAQAASLNGEPDQFHPNERQQFRATAHGLDTRRDLFTNRQYAALATFSSLVAEVREKVRNDALAVGMDASDLPLAEGGAGARAYSDAVATYLGLAVNPIGRKKLLALPMASSQFEYSQCIRAKDITESVELCGRKPLLRFGKRLEG